MWPLLASGHEAEYDKLTTAALARYFSQPPMTYRPYVWWHWMGSNFSKEGIRKDLESGEAFADAVSKSKLFDGLHDRMIRMGVAAGREDQVMAEIAQQTEEEAEEGIARLVGIIEPTLVALLSVVIGAILLAVMLPMAGILSSMM